MEKKLVGYHEKPSNNWYGFEVLPATHPLSSVVRWGKMRKYGKSGHFLIAEISGHEADGFFVVNRSKITDKELLKELNRIHSRIQEPAYPAPRFWWSVSWTLKDEKYWKK